MCEVEVIAKKKKVSGTNEYEVFTSCKKSGKPITVANKWGMFCEDMCDLNACKDAAKKNAAFLSDLGINLEGII